jgi:hypothetical protein
MGLNTKIVYSDKVKVVSRHLEHIPDLGNCSFIPEIQYSRFMSRNSRNYEKITDLKSWKYSRNSSL